MRHLEPSLSSLSSIPMLSLSDSFPVHATHALALEMEKEASIGNAFRKAKGYFRQGGGAATNDLYAGTLARKPVQHATVTGQSVHSPGVPYAPQPGLGPTSAGLAQANAAEQAGSIGVSAYKNPTTISPGMGETPTWTGWWRGKKPTQPQGMYGQAHQANAATIEHGGQSLPRFSGDLTPENFSVLEGAEGNFLTRPVRNFFRERGFNKMNPEAQKIEIYAGENAAGKQIRNQITVNPQVAQQYRTQLAEAGYGDIPLADVERLLVQQRLDQSAGTLGRQQLQRQGMDAVRKLEELPGLAEKSISEAGRGGMIQGGLIGAGGGGAAGFVGGDPDDRMGSAMRGAIAGGVLGAGGGGIYGRMKGQREAINAFNQASGGSVKNLQQAKEFVRNEENLRKAFEAGVEPEVLKALRQQEGEYARYMRPHEERMAERGLNLHNEPIGMSAVSTAPPAPGPVEPGLLQQLDNAAGSVGEFVSRQGGINAASREAQLASEIAATNRVAPRTQIDVTPRTPITQVDVPAVNRGAQSNPLVQAFLDARNRGRSPRVAAVPSGAAPRTAPLGTAPTTAPLGAAPTTAGLGSTTSFRGGAPLTTPPSTWVPSSAPPTNPLSSIAPPISPGLPLVNPRTPSAASSLPTMPAASPPRTNPTADIVMPSLRPAPASAPKTAPGLTGAAPASAASPATAAASPAPTPTPGSLGGSTDAKTLFYEDTAGLNPILTQKPGVSNLTPTTGLSTAGAEASTNVGNPPAWTVSSYRNPHGAAPTATPTAPPSTGQSAVSDISNLSSKVNSTPANPSTAPTAAVSGATQQPVKSFDAASFSNRPLHMEKFEEGIANKVQKEQFKNLTEEQQRHVYKAVSGSPKDGKQEAFNRAMTEAVDPRRGYAVEVGNRIRETNIPPSPSIAPTPSEMRPTGLKIERRPDAPHQGTGVSTSTRLGGKPNVSSEVSLLDSIDKTIPGLNRETQRRVSVLNPMEQEKITGLVRSLRDSGASTAKINETVDKVINKVNALPVTIKSGINKPASVREDILARNLFSLPNSVWTLDSHTKALEKSAAGVGASAAATASIPGFIEFLKGGLLSTGGTAAGGLAAVGLPYAIGKQLATRRAAKESIQALKGAMKERAALPSRLLNENLPVNQIIPKRIDPSTGRAISGYEQMLMQGGSPVHDNLLAMNDVLREQIARGPVSRAFPSKSLGETLTSPSNLALGGTGLAAGAVATQLPTRRPAIDSRFTVPAY